jgi:glycine cleavage system H protein
MAKNPEDRRYTKEHEWVKIADGQAVIGVTDYAQEQMGDVVFVELPDIGTKVEASAVLGTIESVKAVSDLYSPISGEVIETNGDVVDKPEMLNKDPFGAAWLVKIKPNDAGEVESLLSPEQYDAETA